MAPIRLEVTMFFSNIIAFAAAVAVSTIAPSQSAGDGWNYTRWGMTPEEVVAASNGAARLHSPPPVTGATGMILAIGTLPGGAFEFEVSFVFDQSRRLTHVNLKAPPSECPPVIRELYRVYGTPYHSPRSNVAVQAAWENRAKNLDVRLFAAGVSCLVTYSPARPAVTGL